METLAGNCIQLVLPWPVRIPVRTGISFTLRFRIRFGLYPAIRNYNITKIIHLLPSEFHALTQKTTKLTRIDNKIDRKSIGAVLRRGGKKSLKNLFVKKVKLERRAQDFPHPFLPDHPVRERQVAVLPIMSDLAGRRQDRVGRCP